MRTDVVRMYKDIHSWVGIVSGLALFIAFYAGAITMFAEPLQRWASPPPPISPPPSLADTPDLIAKVVAAYPAAARSHDIHIETGPETPARLSWSIGNRREPGITHYASLDGNGALEVTTRSPSAVADLIDRLHQQVGLPLERDTALLIMGVIALLYAVALISGVICLLPSLVKDLFALRIGKNVKRMWLDLHNLLGLFSLPFHIVMALTSVVFAFHDQFYDAQGAIRQVGQPRIERRPDHPSAPAAGTVLPPAAIAARVSEQLPGFTLATISYSHPRDGSATVRITGSDPRYGMRGPTFTLAEVDPYSGRITEADYLPRLQSGGYAAVTSFFALHFGSFGGAPIRWAYFFLGLAGAFLFYSGNLLWIESRRKKERKDGAVEQTRSTKILAALTVGVPLGCVTGISTTIAAAKWLPPGMENAPAWHDWIYYLIFLAMVGWALLLGAARSGPAQIWTAAAATALIPATSALAASGTGMGWNHVDGTLLIDIIAGAGSVGLALMALAARKRALQGARDSVWARPLSRRATA